MHERTIRGHGIFRSVLCVALRPGWLAGLAALCLVCAAFPASGADDIVINANPSDAAISMSYDGSTLTATFINSSSPSAAATLSGPDLVSNILTVGRNATVRSTTGDITVGAPLGWADSIRLTLESGHDAVIGGNIGGATADSQQIAVQAANLLAVNAGTTINGGWVNLTAATVQMNGAISYAGGGGVVMLDHSGDGVVGTGGTISANAFTKSGLGALTVAGAIAATGGVSVTGGSLTVGNGATAGTLSAPGVTLAAGATLAFSRSDEYTYSGNIANDGTVIQRGSAALTLDGSISGAGSVAVEGYMLTLEGNNNTYAGGTIVNAGKMLQLRNAGTLPVDGVLTMHQGAALFLEASSVITVSEFQVLGSGVNISGSGGNLDLSGQRLTFDAVGLTTLTAAPLAAYFKMQIDPATTVTLLNLSDALQPGNRIALATDLAPASAVAGGTLTSGRKSFILEIDGSMDLFAVIRGINSFVDATAGYLASAGFGNRNTFAGGLSLDALAGVPGFDIVPFDNYFTRVTDTLSPLPGMRELERLHGAYAAYKDTALATTTERFNRLWHGQARSFVDRSVFAGLYPQLSDAGFASPEALALAAPQYGPRDSVPAGHSRIWGGGFGAWATQDGADRLAGYKYDSQGAVLGYEYLVNSCLALGVAGAYSRGDLKIGDLGYENKPDIMNLALYGVYTHPSGLYAQGGVGYGHAWNDYSVAMLLGGRKTGKYGSDDWSADAEVGYVARLPKEFNLIPSVGLEYDCLRSGAWSERAFGDPDLVANRFDGQHDSNLGVPLGLRFNKLFRFGCNGGYVVPEVRAAYVWQAGESRPSVASGFVGAPGAATVVGVDPGRSHWRVGAGVSGRFNERVDFRVDYDYDARSGYRGHNVMATVGLAF